jgi:hypothetical protein
MSRPIQTAIWWRQAQWMMTQSRRRLGPVFTLEIAYGDQWVILSDPELVKQVFTGDPKVFHAGEATTSCARCSARTRCWCSTRPRT